MNLLSCARKLDQSHSKERRPASKESKMTESVFDPFAAYDRETLVASDPVEIEAPAAIVWQVLTDMPRYGEWNPFCVGARSTLEMGAPVFMTLVDYTTPG